jgi:hypothetical protein
MSMDSVCLLKYTVDDRSSMKSMGWLDEMNCTLENEGFRGPEWSKSVEKARLVRGVRNSWLFSNALRYSGLMYLKHCIGPFADSDKWDLNLGPRLVANLVEGSVRRNSLKFLQSAFFLLSLGSMKGETIVDFSGTKNWYTVCRDKSICFCVFRILREEKWWIKDEPFYQLARRFIDELLRRTDARKLEKKSYREVAGFCRILRQREVSSAGLASFLRAVECAEAALTERKDEEEKKENKTSSGSLAGHHHFVLAFGSSVSKEEQTGRDEGEDKDI